MDASRGGAEVPRIVSAAVQYQGVIFSLPRPARHHVILHAMHAMGLPKESRRGQGFLTSEGRFVDRSEARRVALAAGQVTEDKLHHQVHLFTEDLW